MTDSRISPDSAATTERPFKVERHELDPKQVELELSGLFDFAQATALWNELRVHVDAAEKGGALHFDMAGVERVDGGIMALLAHLRAELQQGGVKAEFLNAPEPIQEIIHLYRGDVRVGRRKPPKPQSMFAQIGRATMDIVLELQLMLGFLGQMLIALAGVIRSPKTGNFREVFPTMERTGADAVPIVILINFLVGFVMALQASVQLKAFGANIFVADLIGISMTRELGPLMTAIVLSGRSGAAFAAELGSMKVNEEVDALTSMGLLPMRFLVLPRAIALMIVMPILSLLADLVGIIGGLIVGLTSLDLTTLVYIHEIQKAVKPWDVYSGLIKSVIFGLAIALISCQQGLATTGGAEGVGRRTTSAVVASLFTLILIDATYTIVFRALDV